MSAIENCLKALQLERLIVAKNLLALDRAIEALQSSEGEPAPAPKRKYQRSKSVEVRTTPSVVKPAGKGDLSDPRCGRGDCTHTKSQHTKKDEKCGAPGCWCYGFVQRAA